MLTAKQMIISIIFLCMAISSHAADGYISGKVYWDENSDTPIPGIFVICYDYDSGIYENMDMTQADGSYKMSVSPGNYKVFAQSENESPYISEFYGNTFDGYYAKRVNVLADEHINNINFGLTKGGIIHGRVFDINKNPLVHLRIEAYDLNGELRGYEESLENGHYYLHVPEGEYRLMANPINRNYVAVFYNHTFHFHEARIFAVKTGIGYEYYDFYLLEGIQVQGLITQQGSNEPVSDATIWALGSFQHSASSLEDGWYSFIIPPDDYQFQVEKPGYVNYISEIITVEQNMRMNFTLQKKVVPVYSFSDCIQLLQCLSGLPGLSLSNMDLNKDGQLDITDAISILVFLSH